MMQSGGKVSSELIFRSDYFQLIGNDPLKETGTSNPWYLERIVKYCEHTEDPNMISALRKIASSYGADEAVRHRAAGLIDRLEERKPSAGLLIARDSAKSMNAMLLLAGSRTPQTAEILRLLRDKNIASRRYAILMIGKFQLADLAGEVCDCLPVPGLSRVSADVLQSFGKKASDELIHLYMNSSGSRGTGRIIVTLLGKTGSAGNNEFIFSLLWSNSREIRFIAAETLKNNHFTATGERAGKVYKLISDVIGVITWNLAARESLEKSRRTNLVRLIDDEITEWKSFIINLLSLCADKAVVEAIEGNLNVSSMGSACYAAELIDRHTDESVKNGLIELFVGSDIHAALRKLKRKWPVSVKESGNLFEDLINRDYNLINTWTKTSVLREINAGEDENVFDSVKALLFSPMSLLREEAALALTRSGRSIPEELFSRLPGDHLVSIRKIMAGSVAEKDLYHFRVAFLSRLFTGVPPEELITLAGSLNYYLNEELSDDKIINSIAWEADINWVVRRCLIITDENNKLPLVPVGEGPWIILSLNAIDNFILVYPERAEQIYDYLDSKGIITAPA